MQTSQFVVTIIFFGSLVNGVSSDDEILDKCLCQNDVCYKADDVSRIRQRAWDDIFRAEELKRKLYVEIKKRKFKFEINPTDENFENMADAEHFNDIPNRYILDKLDVYYLLEPFLQDNASVAYLIFYKSLQYGTNLDNIKNLEKKINDKQGYYREKMKAAKICDFETRTQQNCTYIKLKDIYKILRTSQDPEELKYVWVELTKDAIGNISEANIIEHFALEQQRSKEKFGFGIVDREFRLFGVKDKEKFVNSFDEMFETMKPFHQQLHAYVRHKLRKRYGEHVISKKGPIPVHLTGNLLGQNWNNLWDIVKPYPDEESQDLDQEMIQQGYTTETMLNLTEDYFVSMGLPKLPNVFWENSRFNVTPRLSTALVSKVDLNNYDLRLIMDVHPNIGDLIILHHEFGHVYEQLFTKHILYSAQGAPNKGLSEGHGEAMALSVLSPKHLHKIGLLCDSTINKKNEINSLLKKALDDIPFLAYSYELSKWSWDVYDTVLMKDLNKNYWKLRMKYSGVYAAGECRGSGYFDAVLKAHIKNHYLYFLYTAGTFYKYMILESLCREAGEYVPNDPNKPVYNCDLYGSKEAGEKYIEFLQAGRADGFELPLQKLTGYKTMSSEPIIGFYQPLLKWLKEENEKNGEFIGWEDDTGCDLL